MWVRLPPSAPKMKSQIIVVLGPTATGKSALAVKLARVLKGEIISADSRQVYKGLDIGSGKITPAEMKGVPHHLLDVASPKSRNKFTVAQFQKMGQKIVQEIIERGNVPIICGGSAFYIQALVDGITLPEVLPNPKLRARLEKMPLKKLQAMLKKLDPRRFAEIDQDNPVRLIRAIEIATELGKVPALKKSSEKSEHSPYNPLFIGLNLSADELHKKIKKRLDSRLQDGMINEVAQLHKDGVTWKRLESFGLEYRAIAEFLQKKISAEEMSDKIETETRQFAKRQMTWFKKDRRIKWFSPKAADWPHIKKIALSFLTK